MGTEAGARPDLPGAVSRRTVWCLGLSQLVCWGITFYMIALFGELIAADMGWSRSIVFGGFSAALVVMGATSPLVGRLIDERGGRPVMVAGSCLSALGCVVIAFGHDLVVYYAGWLVLGLAMRMCLYEAAFAALARIAGPAAKRPISQITLLGGLASTAFWPIGHALAEAFGWRGALLCYAAIALMTIPLHLAIQPDRFAHPPAPKTADGKTAAVPGRFLAGLLYVTSVTLVNFLASGMSAHMIGLLGGLGLAAGVAVWISTLRGIGQSSARLCDVLFGGRLHPTALNLIATGALPVCFVAGLFGGFVPAAIAFAFLYGAGNGLLTITRGTLPLVLFDPRTYGALVGRLLVPSFFLSAAAPLVYAVVIERFGDAAALAMSLGIALVIVAAGIVLYARFGRGEQSPS